MQQAQHEHLSITHLLSPAPPLGAEESLLLDESSELDDDEEESSDPAAQNLDMVAYFFREEAVFAWGVCGPKLPWRK
jgi:hypothetical protein